MNLDRLAALGATLVVTIAVVVGLVLAGSPAEERDRRIDEQRIAALQHLASVISIYHRETGNLPARLAELVDGRNLQELPADPRTGQPYEYEQATDGSYALCAIFDAASQTVDAVGFWLYAPGRNCFRLTPDYGEN